MERIGVILARLQPIHNGHLELIRQAIAENDRVLLLVGSADKLNKRNPIPISMRLDLAKQSIAESFGDDAKNVMIEPLNDLRGEGNDTNEWGFYLFAHIVKVIGTPYFTMYYSDGFETIMRWFPGFITRDFVSFKINARGAIHNNLSATKVREMIINGDADGLEDVVPRCVIENMTMLKHFIGAFKDVGD